VGLAQDLGYVIPRPNVLQRTTQRVASTRPGAWVFARTLRHLDDIVLRVSRGRTSAPEILAGLPVLDVTTMGRRSGQARRTHLIAVPYADSLALLGTNFGQPGTPAWVLNLEADPHVGLTHHGTTLAAVARPASADEQDAVLAGSASVYGGYLRYQQRISRRRLRVFVLEPADT
jgi:deazaflavin-dependent oxidoreductase (nitroreductase family)